MVTMNEIKFTTDLVNGQTLRNPVVHVHRLNCKKDAPTFESGQHYVCYITAYDGGRFAVFTMSGVKKTSYHVFESEKEMHEHFDELPA